MEAALRDVSYVSAPPRSARELQRERELAAKAGRDFEEPEPASVTPVDMHFWRRQV